MKMKHTDVPVLYIAFARPEYARQSFNAIKAAKPKKFYFIRTKVEKGMEMKLSAMSKLDPCLKK